MNKKKAFPARRAIENQNKIIFLKAAYNDMPHHF